MFSKITNLLEFAQKAVTRVGAITAHHADFEDDAVAKVRAAVSAYRGMTNLDRADVVRNLMCGLMYLCERDDRYGSFSKAAERADIAYIGGWIREDKFN